MAKIALFCLAFTAIFLGLDAASGLKDRKILLKQFEHSHINQSTLNDVRLKLRESTISHLRELSKAEQQELKTAADHAYKNEKYEQLTAWDWLEYDRTGSPAHYQTKLDSRNRRLTLLVAAHLLDESHNLNSNLYVDEIFNGVWMILEDTNWAYPWTMVHLPEANEIWVDLGAAEMAKQLALVKVLMEEKFAAVKDAKINERIDAELKKRVFDPYTKFSFKWDGLESGHKIVNNWNSWINSNILRAAVYSHNNEAEFNKLFQKTIRSVDVFLNSYGDDGGCEEGPSFWIEAGGRLIEYVMTLVQLDPASRDYFAKQTHIKAIGDYSWKLRVSGQNFISFSDSLPRIQYPPSMIHQYGELFEDPVMKHYASYLFEQTDKKLHVKDLGGFVSFVHWRARSGEYSPIAPEPPTMALHDLQISASRPKPNRNDTKLMVAGRMGSNYEFHSHNDIGNYVIYQNGHPVLIDVGAGDFTAKTNGPKRYSELFYTQSQYHNCPSINGINQRSGYPAQASDVSIVVGGDESFVTLRGNIRDAYPANAEIQSWNRIIHHDRNIDEVKVQDFFQLKQFLGPHKFNFMTVAGMNITRVASGLRLTNDDVYVNMEFHWSLFDLETEQISLKGDKALSEAWGDSVQRFMLTTKKEDNNLLKYITFVFRSDDYVPVIPL